MLGQLQGKTSSEQCDIIVEKIREAMEKGPDKDMVSEALGAFNADNLYYLDSDAHSYLCECARKHGSFLVWGHFLEADVDFGVEDSSDESEDDMVPFEENFQPQTIKVFSSEC